MLQNRDKQKYSFFWIEIKIFIEILRSEVFCDEIKKLYFDFNIVGFRIKEQQIMQSLRDENTNRTFSRHKRGSAFFKRVYSDSSSRQSSGGNKRYKTYLESCCRTIDRKIKANRRQVFMHFDGMLLSKKVLTSFPVVKKLEEDLRQCWKEIWSATNILKAQFHVKHIGTKINEKWQNITVFVISTILSIYILVYSWIQVVLK